MIHRPSSRFRVSNFRCEKPEMELSGNGGGAEVEKKSAKTNDSSFDPPSVKKLVLLPPKLSC